MGTITTTSYFVGCVLSVFRNIISCSNSLNYRSLLMLASERQTFTADLFHIWGIGLPIKFVKVQFIFSLFSNKTKCHDSTLLRHVHNVLKSMLAAYHLTSGHLCLTWSIPTASSTDVKPSFLWKTTAIAY